MKPQGMKSGLDLVAGDIFFGDVLNYVEKIWLNLSNESVLPPSPNPIPSYLNALKITYSLSATCTAHESHRSQTCNAVLGEGKTGLRAPPLPMSLTVLRDVEDATSLSSSGKHV